MSACCYYPYHIKGIVMYARDRTVRGKESRAAARSVAQKRNDKSGGMEFVDNRDLPGAAFIKKQPIQRQILKESGVIRNIRLAEKHANLDTSLGFTPPTVNSNQIAKAPDVVAAFKGEDKLVEIESNGEDGYTAKVDTVPTNHVGYLMYLPVPGPWVQKAKKSDILALLGEQDNGLNQTDEIIVEITGPKGHDKLVQQIEKHEKVHAKDNEKIRDSILKPWDAGLTGLKQANRTFPGDNAKAASAKLWASVGGTVKQKSVEVNDAWGKASDSFHQHKKGKTKVDDAGTKINSDQTKAVFSYYLTV